MAASTEFLVWIDCEMTGLDVNVDELVEVAVIVTDSDLTPLHEGMTVVIKPHQSALDHMNDFVREMHTTSGLIEEIPHGVDVAEAEYMIVEYLLGLLPEDARPPLAGNSIATDRGFLSRYMPKLDGHLHYRNVDVSSFKEMARRWYPRVYFNAPAKDGGHRALADIRESIRELEYYRQALMAAPPGPSSDQAAAVAASVTEKYAL